MELSVEQIDETRESFGMYRYRILDRDQEVAVFSHNYRGECELVRTTDGYEEDPPFGMSSDFLTGGGPEPLGFTKKAKKYLETLLQDHGSAQQTDQ